MEILNDEVVYDGKYRQFIKRHYVDRLGGRRVWEMVKGKAPGAALIVAITPEREIVLEKTFRVPCKAWVVELPAGLIDPGEEDEAAARRELLEETGYAADKFELLTKGTYNPALTADRGFFFLARDARYVAEPKLEATEEIEIVKVPLGGLFEYLIAEKNIIVDQKIFLILPFLAKRGLIKF